MRRETGVKGWTEKRASEGDHRPSSWSKTQEEVLGFKEERERGVEAVDIAFSLGDYKKRSSSRRLQRRRTVARRGVRRVETERRELDYVLRKSSRGESREPASFFRRAKERDDARKKKKRESSEGRLFSLSCSFPATEGGTREIKRERRATAGGSGCRSVSRTHSGIILNRSRVPETRAALPILTSLLTASLTLVTQELYIISYKDRTGVV